MLPFSHVFGTPDTLLMLRFLIGTFDTKKSRKKLGVVVAGTQRVDRWWQSLAKALPASLHVKDRPGGGIAEKQMSYVWGFVWRSNLGNHANLIKELGKIM